MSRYKPVDKRPRCTCGHLWWWHSREPKACGIYMNYPQLSLDGKGIEVISENRAGTHCLGFRWRKICEEKV